MRRLHTHHTSRRSFNALCIYFYTLMGCSIRQTQQWSPSGASIQFWSIQKTRAFAKRDIHLFEVWSREKSDGLAISITPPSMARARALFISQWKGQKSLVSGAHFGRARHFPKLRFFTTTAQLLWKSAFKNSLDGVAELPPGCILLLICMEKNNVIIAARTKKSTLRCREVPTRPLLFMCRPCNRRGAVCCSRLAQFLNSAFVSIF